MPPNSSLQRPHLIKQHELNNLILVLDLSLKKTEIMVSRLKEWHLLAQTRKYVCRGKETDACPNFLQTRR